MKINARLVVLKQYLSNYLVCPKPKFRNLYLKPMNCHFSLEVQESKFYSVLYSALQHTVCNIT